MNWMTTYGQHGTNSFANSPGTTSLPQPSETPFQLTEWPRPYVALPELYGDSGLQLSFWVLKNMQAGTSTSTVYTNMVSLGCKRRMSGSSYLRRMAERE